MLDVESCVWRADSPNALLYILGLYGHLLECFAKVGSSTYDVSLSTWLVWAYLGLRQSQVGLNCFGDESTLFYPPTNIFLYKYTYKNIILYIVKSSPQIHVSTTLLWGGEPVILYIIDFLLQMSWIHKQGMIGKLNKHNEILLLLNAFHLCQFPVE